MARKPLRVAMFVTRMDIGGVPDHVMTLLDGFSPEIRVTLITDHIHPDHQTEIDSMGIEARLLPVSRLLDVSRDLKTLRELRRILSEGHFDILHTHMSKPALLGAIVGFLSPKIAVVNTAHNFGFIAMPQRWKKAVFWAYDKLISMIGIDATITVSQSVGTAVVNARLIPKNRLHVIPNGIRLNAFMHQKQADRDLRHELSGDADSKLIVCVARLVWFKGLDTLLNAFARISKNHPKARLVIIGDGELRDDLMAQALELECADKVQFCGERRDVPDVLNVSDLFVLSSVSEGLPISILEAMAARLPVIATDVGGISELVVPGETGSLVPSGDDKQLAKAIDQILERPDLALKYGESGYDRLCKEFSQNAMVNRTEELYLRLAARKPEMTSA